MKLSGRTRGLMGAMFAVLGLCGTTVSRAQDAPAAASGTAARQATRAAATADAEPAAIPPAGDQTRPAATLRPPAKAAAARMTDVTGATGGKGTMAGRGTTGKAGSRKDAHAMDTLELDTTQITGNRELPKVMVVVPWKRSDIGDLVGRPVNSLVDEALAPVDREVFRREIAYYGALAPDQPRNETSVTPATTAAPAAKPEK